MASKLEGRVALITGASKGLGRVLARKFGAAGCKVGVHYFSHSENAEETAHAIRSAGGEAVPIQANLSLEPEVERLFSGIAGKLGPVDILLNNARVDPYKRPPGLTEGEWFDRVTGVGLRAAYLCAIRAFDSMKSRGWGRIINVSSVNGVGPSRLFLIPYGIAKTGMLNITRSLALAGAEFGITVNTLAPGLIITETLEERITAEEIARAKAAIPLRRGATMEEVADAALYLAGAGFVTGETLNINGGVYLP
jgi:3-oxoacyl-[acyl-carrier protein] reductase